MNVLGKKLKSPNAPAEPEETIHIDPTNVHFIFLTQNLFF